MEKFTAEKMFDLWKTDYAALELDDDGDLRISIRVEDKSEHFDEYVMYYPDITGVTGMTEDEYKEWLENEDSDIGEIYGRWDTESDAFREAIEAMTDEINQKIDEWNDMSVIEKCHRIGCL